MGTSIQWTNETWNPVTGCSKVSQGCKNCYAERIWKRVYGSRPFTDVRCHPERLEQPLHWKKPRRVFVNSMSDLFHESVPEEFIRAVFTIMRQAQQHTFQVLTKRPERMLEIIGTWQKNGLLLREGHGCVLPNVWLGVSVENQKYADERIPLLLQTPAAVRFLSVEPMLEAISLRWKNSTPLGVSHPRHLKPKPDERGSVCTNEYDGLRELDWVICGGESGPSARPFNLSWAESLLKQCKAAEVPFFFKQVGSNPVIETANVTHSYGWYKLGKGGDMSEWPEHLRVREFPV